METQRAVVDRLSDVELVVTRTFDAPVHRVFDAWTRPEIFRQWWVPKTMPVPLRSCEMDVRVGGTYRLVFGHDASQTMAFFGRYLEVVAPSRLVWSNEESDQGAVTTVTFEDHGGRTRVVFHERYPSKAALDESIAGMEGGLPEQFAQLDELLLGLGADVT